MTTLVYSRNLGVSTGASYVTMVATPAASHVKMVRNVSICNTDTVPATITIAVTNSAVNYPVSTVTMAAGDTYTYTQPINMTPGDTLRLTLAAPVATTELTYVTSWADIS